MNKEIYLTVDSIRISKLYNFSGVFPWNNIDKIWTVAGEFEKRMILKR